MKKLLLFILLFVGCENNSTQSILLDIIGSWAGTEINREELLRLTEVDDFMTNYKAV